MKYNYIQRGLEATTILLKRWYDYGGSLCVRPMYPLMSKSLDKFIFMYLEEKGLYYSHSTLNNVKVELEPEIEHRFDNGIILGSVPKELVMKFWKEKSKFPQFILSCEKHRKDDLDYYSDAVVQCFNCLKFCKKNNNKPYLFAENSGRAAIRQEESGDLLLSGMTTSVRAGEITFEETRNLVEKGRDVFARLEIEVKEKAPTKQKNEDIRRKKTVSSKAATSPSKRGTERV
ncbi:hypothetical protein ABK040_012537 [Willaertia magna]